MIKQIALFFCLLFFVVACKKDKASVFTCTDEVSFSQEVKPLIDLNCSTSGCHDASAAGGYEFKDHASISTASDRIISAINHDSGTSPMPVGAAKLPDSLIKIVVCWSSAGKLDN